MYSDHKEATLARLNAADEPQPRVMCAKVVPDRYPNVAGYWQKVVLEPRHYNPKKYGADRNQTMFEAAVELVPAGHHVVAFTDNLELDGKSGDTIR